MTNFERDFLISRIEDNRKLVQAMAASQRAHDVAYTGYYMACDDFVSMIKDMHGDVQTNAKLLTKVLDVKWTPE